MTASGQYEVVPEAVRGVLGNMVGIALQAFNTVMEMESLVLAPTSFATIGSPVAGANTAMHAQMIATARSLVQLLQQTNDLVHRVANDYDSADQAIAIAFGGNPAEGNQPGNVAVPPASALANFALNDSAGSDAEPQSVGNVLGYLSATRMGELGNRPITDVTFPNADNFADWLDANPYNQSRVGLLGVYSGDVTNLGSVPGGVHRGDLVVMSPQSLFGSTSDTVIGIAGGDGKLYNHGQISADTPFGANIRIYRPMNTATALW